jgi:hypothetical protein
MMACFRLRRAIPAPGPGAGLSSYQARFLPSRFFSPFLSLGPALRPASGYQLDFTTPGMSPWEERVRKQIRHIPNLR